MADPLVTAVVDTCNYAHFLPDAIESVLSQEFPERDLEILVVDDGSTDNTQEVVKRFGDRVRYLPKPRGGQASALNLGLREARGAVLALLDADDFWMPNKVRVAVEALERRPDVGLVYHPFVVWDSVNGIEAGNPRFVSVSGFIPDNLRLATLYSCQATSGLVIRREVVEKVGPIPEGLKIMADWYLGSAAAFVAPVLAVDQRLSTYRIHGSNLYNDSSGDRERLQLKLDCQGVLVNEFRKWLLRQGYPLQSQSVAVHLKKLELEQEELAFAMTGVTRWHYLRHLREKRRIYWKFWSTRYRAFQGASCVVGFVLGYKGHRSVMQLYSRTKSLGGLRKVIAPQFAESTQTL